MFYRILWKSLRCVFDVCFSTTVQLRLKVLWFAWLIRQYRAKTMARNRQRNGVYLVVDEVHITVIIINSWERIRQPSLPTVYFFFYLCVNILSMRRSLRTKTDWIYFNIRYEELRKNIFFNRNDKHSEVKLMLFEDHSTGEISGRAVKILAKSTVCKWCRRFKEVD